MLATLGASVLAVLAAVTGTLQVLSPIFHKTGHESEWLSLGKQNEFDPGHPTPKVIHLVVQDGWQTRKQSQMVYVLLKEGKPVVFSSVCPHLSCPVSYQKEERTFHCPCHQSYWDAEGRRLSGPASRGMDLLPSKVEGEEVFCRWVQYRAGLSEAVEV